MGQTYTPPTPFAAWLKGELDQRNWGVRTLAKRMDPENVEVARRALNRVIHEGTLPTEPTRAAIARGLGIQESELPSTERADDDDEEADPVALLLARAVELAVELALVKKQSPPPDLTVIAGTGSDRNGG